MQYLEAASATWRDGAAAKQPYHRGGINGRMNNMAAMNCLIYQHSVAQ
jgi:hypothetical protein